MANVAERVTLAGWRSSKLAFVSRILLGVILVAASITNFLARNPVSNPTVEGTEFLHFLNQNGYLLQAAAVTELVSGLLLLSGRFIPLALVLFAPILVTIFLFHAFLQLAGVETALVAASLYGHLVFVFRHRFAGVLSP